MQALNEILIWWRHSKGIFWKIIMLSLLNIKHVFFGVGAIIVGAMIVEAMIVGAMIVGAMIVRAMIVGAMIVETMVVGAMIVGAMSLKTPLRTCKS